jgi:hypothetical protein
MTSSNHQKQYRISFSCVAGQGGLQQEIAALQNRKEIVESNTAEIRAIFKGLEPYRENDKDYLLTPEGWTIHSAGKLGKRDAWIIVRK